MHRVFEREVIGFIRSRGRKKWILLGDLCQEFIEVFVMHKNGIPLVNVEKDFQREGIKLRASFRRTVIFSRESGIFKGGGGVA